MDWPNKGLLETIGMELPIIQAPMAGPVFADMVVAVSEAGGLGSLPCATMTAELARSELARIRESTSRPINVNFFCHDQPADEPGRDMAWRRTLEPYYREFGLDPQAPFASSSRNPFDDEFCGLVEEFRPEVVSFHFGLPSRRLVDRVKSTGAKVFSSATTVEEARWLELRGCDAVIAQGFEAGGHRGNFLVTDMATQVGTLALVPQVVDAVRVPVISAGGIADARGIVAALALGASAVQIGTAYLFTPEARLTTPHRKALRDKRAEETALTNVFTGRPARGILNRVMRELGPMSSDAPSFPLAGGALAPLRAATEKSVSGDFMSLWSGQAARLCRERPAGELTRQLAADAQGLLARMGERRE